MEEEAIFRRVDWLRVLVVVDNFDLICISSLPTETDAVPLVDANAYLTLPVTLQRFKPVSGWHQEVPQIDCPVDLIELPPGYDPQPLGTPLSGSCGRNSIVDVLGATVMEGLYHASRYTI